MASCSQSWSKGIFPSKSVIRKYHYNLSNILGCFPELLLAVSARFYQDSFIDLRTKQAINTSGGLAGADMLLNYVQVKLEQSEDYLPLVLDILREEVALKEIVQNMEHSLASVKVDDATSAMQPSSSINSTSIIVSSTDDVFTNTVAETISAAEKLMDSFRTLIYFLLTSTSQSPINLFFLKGQICLFLQYTRENTPQVQKYLNDLEQCQGSESIIMFLINKNMLGYMNFQFLDAIKPLLTSDEFSDKFDEYKTMYKTFMRNSIQNIVEAFKQKPKLVPLSIVGLPQFIVELTTSWQSKSLYQWKEIVDDIVDWGEYILMDRVDVNCITYHVMPFILPRIVKDLTNDNIIERLSAVGATFVVPNELLLQGREDIEWIQALIHQCTSNHLKKNPISDEIQAVPTCNGDSSDDDYSSVKQTTSQLQQSVKDVSSSNTEGYDDKLFLLPPPKDLQCPICQLTAREPLLSSCCGLTLCQVCSDCTSATVQCPVCKSTNHSLMVDKKTRGRIMSLQVKCPVVDCSWAGELLDLQYHQQTQNCPIISTVDQLTKAHQGVIVASGRMKVACFLLHGSPRVGKTSVKNLVLGKPPTEQDSTGLIEDPVRAISTVRLMNVQETSIEEMDEQKMIRMIQFEIHKAVEECKRKLDSTQPSDTAATDHKQNTQPAHSTTPQSTSSSSTEQRTTSFSASKIEKYHHQSKVFSKIAADLKQIDPGTPSLFECKHVHLIDSGGQPQFTNLLSLVLQSQSYHHMVVIRLDQKLSDKPRNCFEVNGVKHVFPEHLLLTNYQLIEQVCQLAVGSNSLVIIIGTRLDQENVEEPLAKKNELLVPLMKKYEYTLVLTEEDEPIFAINAMIPEGAERIKCAETLRRVLLDAPVLGDEGREYAKEGIKVPLRWIILELEMSHHSKAVGILDKAEINNLAQTLEIANLDVALEFFKQLALHYHYPEVLPNKIFTSIAPISSRLSKIVEATFPHRKPLHKNPDQVTLQKTGELSYKFLKEIIVPLLETVDDQFSVDDFIRLMLYLRIIFKLEDGAFFIPIILPLEVKSAPDDGCHPEHLFLFWLNENKKVCILPLSFFHALVVELLRMINVNLNRNKEQTRTSFVFIVNFESGNQCQMVLTNHVFWMELKTSDYSKPDERESIKAFVQSSTQRVLEQLKLSSLGELVVGVECQSKQCEIDYPHPSVCVHVQSTEHTFSCVVAEGTHEWRKSSKEQLYWFQDMSTAAHRLKQSDVSLSGSTDAASDQTWGQVLCEVFKYKSKYFIWLLKYKYKYMS